MQQPGFSEFVQPFNVHTVDCIAPHTHTHRLQHDSVLCVFDLNVIGVMQNEDSCFKLAATQAASFFLFVVCVT